MLHINEFPIALIEAKHFFLAAGDGIQQALEYAETLEILSVFSSNGRGFVFHDRTGNAAQLETTLDINAFPSPDELWLRYRVRKGLTPAQEKIVQQPYFDELLRDNLTIP